MFLGKAAKMTENAVPYLKLSSGRSMPILGLGTSQFEDHGGVPKANLNGTREAVEYAIDIGYRHFDTAYNYTNEGEIGAAIKSKIQEGVVKREDLFITTKLFNNFHRPEHVARAMRLSLATLQLDYVDLYLIHTPLATPYIDDKTSSTKDEYGKIVYDDVDPAATWKEMEKLVDLGLAKSIGVSNFNIRQTQYILDHSRIKPAVNQVECHAYLMQPKLFEFCQKNNIAITGYAPVGSPARWDKGKDELVLTQDPVVLEIAKAVGKSSTQVLIRYLIERGRIAIPRSTNKAHIQENFDVFGYQLGEEHLAKLDGLDRNLRFFTYDAFKHFPQYPFYDE